MTNLKRIEEQEEKYRIITAKLFKQLCRNCKYLRLQPTDVFCHIDFKLTANTSTIDCEVKEFNPKYEYKYIPLKVAKYNNMLLDHKNKHLLYISFVNGNKAYIFNLSKLDMNKVKKAYWNIKKTEYNDTSEVEKTEMYLLNINDAYRVIDIKDII